MTEDKKRVTVAIPLHLHTKLIDTGIGVNAGIVKGLELLFQDPEANIPESQNSPNDELVIELTDVRAHYEGLQKLLEEKNERIKDLSREIEGLKKEVERLDMFAHYFKSVEVKQIEAPAPVTKKPFWKFW
jgi:predicted RNase H-like nuclease (RuvC/YqgF family)